MPNWEKVIKEFELFIKEFHPACTSEGVELDMFREVLVILKEQKDGYKNILSDYEDLAREHEKLLDKKIPLITNGQAVVLCKDCKYYEPQFPLCKIYGVKDADWFCADGERKTDDA